MEIRYFDSASRGYLEDSIKSEISSSHFKVLHSVISKEFFHRTPELIYITEFLKGDGTISVVKRKDNSFSGSIIFCTTDELYKRRLERLVKRQFPKVTIFQRKDGFGTSSLSLSVTLATKFGVPIGKKKEMKVTEPENLEEAKMILRALIDTEGNVDGHDGRIVVANQSKEFLESYKKVLEKWFDIKSIYLSPTKGWGEKALRVGINWDEDLIKIYKIKLFNPSKQKTLHKIIVSLSKYKKQKEALKIQIQNILKNQPKTIGEISKESGLSPFIIRRLLRSMKCIKTGKRKIGNRFVYLWSIG